MVSSTSLLWTFSEQIILDKSVCLIKSKSEQTYVVCNIEMGDAYTLQLFFSNENIYEKK